MTKPSTELMAFFEPISWFSGGVYNKVNLDNNKKILDFVSILTVTLHFSLVITACIITTLINSTRRNSEFLPRPIIFPL